MNDDFFSQFRQSPRPEFNQALYAKLTQNAKSKPFINRSKRIAFGLAALGLLVFTLYLAAPAAARAVLDDFIAKITLKGMTIWVYNDFPTPSADWERGESYGEIWKPVSPGDISASYPFFAPLPAWVPSGYTLQEQSALYFLTTWAETPSSAVFDWKDNAGQTIQLQVRKGSCPNGPFYDPESPSPVRRSDCTIESFISLPVESEPQVVMIHDQAGIFYRGVFGLADLSGSVQKWNPSRYMSNMDVKKGVTMIWDSEGRTFWLVVVSTTLTKEDLVRFAESIP
jgi:hypothetical protein